MPRRPAYGLGWGKQVKIKRLFGRQVYMGQESSGPVNKQPSGWRGQSGTNLGTRRCRERSTMPEAAGLGSPLVVLEVEPFQGCLAWGPWGLVTLQMWVRWLSVFLRNFTSLSRKCSPKSYRDEGLCQQKSRCEIPDGPGSVSSPGPRRLPGHLGFCPTHLGLASVHPERGCD